MRDLLRGSATTVAVLFLFFGPALLTEGVALSFGASVGLASFIAFVAYLGLNYLFFVGGVYERIER